MRAILPLCAAAALALPGTASAGILVKFSVTEYRLELLPGSDGGQRYLLEFRGKATVFSDPIDITWEVADAERYLPLLQACGDGRINGEVEYEGDLERNAKSLEGKGRLSELRCRRILK